MPFQLFRHDRCLVKEMQTAAAERIAFVCLIVEEGKRG